MKRKLRFCIFLGFILLSASAQHPAIGGYNVYYGSLHNHSEVSGGTGSPAAAYSYARTTAHLDFFGLADHSQSISSEEWSDVRNQADAFNEDGVFTAFYGFEWGSSQTYGHVSVINTEDYCSSDLPINAFTGLVGWLGARPDGIAFFNHPGRENYIGPEFNHFTSVPSDQFVGIELWNGNSDFSMYYYNDGYYSSDNNKSFIDEANNRNWRLGASGSDDNHSGTWGTNNPYRLALLSNYLTRGDLLEAMRARRFFSTLDRNLALSFKINGMEMGSAIPSGNYTARIQATDADGEIFNQVILFNKNHDIVNEWSLNTSSVNVSISLNTINEDYYYVKVRQADGNEAISSPIWIEGIYSNKPPSCSIISPVNGSSFTATSNITISANADDPDGSVTKVEFYHDATKIAEDFTRPFSFTWNNVSTGSYNLSVIASDDSAGTTTSSPVYITVYAIPITVMAEPAAKIYGDADPGLAYTITSGSLDPMDAFTGALTRDAGEDAGTYTIRQGSLMLNSNYIITFVPAFLTISAKPVTVQADAKTKIYGEPDPLLTYRITSGSLIGSIDAFKGTLIRDEGEDAGTYLIKQGTLELNNNYTINFTGAILEINQRPITVSANHIKKKFGEQDPELTYQITSGSLIGKDSFVGSLNRESGEEVGSYAILQGGLSLGSNYILTFIGAEFRITSEFEMKVYPNPFRDQLFFEFELNKGTFISINLCDMYGMKIVTVFSGEADAGYHKYAFRPERISQGLLIYQLVMEGYIAAEGKVIFER